MVLSACDFWGLRFCSDSLQKSRLGLLFRFNTLADYFDEAFHLNFH